MEKDRMTAFSDGVIAVIITIMVLELKVPEGTDWAALGGVVPTFLAYVLSFIYVAIYWNNHHHLLFTLERVNGVVLWANMHLLFWLSLIPFATAWMGANHFAVLPTAIYGVTLLLPAVAYYLLQLSILRIHGPQSLLARALGRDLKGKISPALYVAGIVLSFWSPPAADAVYALVAVMWLIPDRRIERVLERTDALDSHQGR